MKIILRQITVNMLVYGRTAGDAINNAVQAGPQAKLLKAQAEPINPENNQETAKLFHDFVVETGQSIPGFEVDATEPLSEEKVNELHGSGHMNDLDRARILAKIDAGETVEAFQFPQIWMVALTLEDSTVWNQFKPTPAPPLGEGGGMAETRAAPRVDGAAASSAPVTAPASGTLAAPGSDLMTKRSASVDPNDRDPASVPVSPTQANQPKIVQGLPPEAVPLNDQPPASADDSVPTPGGE